VVEREILVGERMAVYRLSAGAVAVGEIAALSHEVRDHAMEDAPFVGQEMARLAHAFLAGAERAEILGGFRNNGSLEAESDHPGGGAADGDVEEDFAREERITGPRDEEEQRKHSIDFL
jgi:hypothetical protein